MFVKTTNNAVTQYPYNVGQLRRDNPNTSFPKRPSDTLLAEWNVHRVTKTDRPAVDHTKNVVEGTPVLIDGTWTQVWETTDATTEEIAEREQARLDAMVVTRAEFAKAAKREGIISHAEAIAWATQQALPQIVLDVFATLPQIDREDAEFEALTSERVRRTAPLITMLQGELSLSDAQVDALFESPDP
jgi:hypothetical protein